MSERIINGAVYCGLCSTCHRLEEKVAEEVEGPVDEPIDRLVYVSSQLCLHYAGMQSVGRHVGACQI